MQIQLMQADIEQAVKDYVLKMGLNREVEEINFTVSRKGGASISADIRISDFANLPAPAAVVPEPVVAAVPAPAVDVEEETPAPYEVAAPTSDVEHVVSGIAAVDADLVKDEEEEAPVTANRSLFG